MSDRDELSMQTDNTPKGDVEGGPITQVKIDNRVVDSTGKEIGRVKFVKMGDPTAVTTAGQGGYDPGFFGFGSALFSRKVKCDDANAFGFVDRAVE